MSPVLYPPLIEESPGAPEDTDIMASGCGTVLARLDCTRRSRGARDEV
ncbi:MAG TPA: hypothetical protein VFA03_05540 [Acetobacteraceae bacterium]|nr:hypothetical protein [Acetobacteraceae bacterium]